MVVAFSCIMRARLTMTNPCVHSLNDILICFLQWWLPTVIFPIPWQPSALTATCVGSVPRWQRPALTTSRVDCVPRWLYPALTASRVACPIRKRALGVPSARVKFLAPRRAKNRPLFLKKGKLGKNIVFLEVKNAAMWIDVCQPSLGESFGWKLPNCNAGYQFL